MAATVTIPAPVPVSHRQMASPHHPGLPSGGLSSHHSLADMSQQFVVSSSSSSYPHASVYQQQHRIFPSVHSVPPSPQHHKPPANQNPAERVQSSQHQERTTNSVTFSFDKVSSQSEASDSLPGDDRGQIEVRGHESEVRDEISEGRRDRACKGKRYKEIVAESGLKSLKRERKVGKSIKEQKVLVSPSTCNFRVT